MSSEHPTLHNLSNVYIFLRHGETDWNKRKIYMGQQDVPLNASGKRQAQEVIFPLQPTVCLSSPLSRAEETANIVINNNRRIPVIVDNRLIEKNGGYTEGLSMSEIRASHLEVWDLWSTATINEILRLSKYDDGESDGDVLERLLNLITELENTYSNEIILLVSHSCVNRLMRVLCGYSKEDAYPGQKLDNCGWEVFYTPTLPRQT